MTTTFGRVPVPCTLEVPSETDDSDPGHVRSSQIRRHFRVPGHLSQPPLLKGPDRLAYLRDTIWTLNSPLLFGLLVHHRGWSPDAYRDWISTALISHTSPSPAEPPSSRSTRAADRARGTVVDPEAEERSIPS
jgi:hypothetical protein